MIRRYFWLFFIIVAIICNECLGDSVRTNAGINNPKILVCEGETARLECGANQVLKITDAFYGRTVHHICSQGKYLSLKRERKEEEEEENYDMKTLSNCKSLQSLQVVQNRCDYKKTCEVPAQSDIFGDPCAGIKKYLAINYECYDVKSNVACEYGSNLELSCPAGKVIKILDGNYGRTTDTICKPGQPNLNCKQPTTANTLRIWCDGFNTCSVKPANSIFGDKCVGTEKYLEATYVCVAPEAMSAVACEHKNLDLSCPSGTVIKILDGNYGRTNNTICIHSRTHVWNCKQPNSKSILSDRCNGTMMCQVAAENSVFTDPCHGVGKYLEVTYNCVHPSVITPVVACEGSNLNLMCPMGQVIKILDGNYGRKRGTICSPNNSNANCVQPTSPSILKERCNGMNTCSIVASNGNFGGDPCGGTSKYLEASYECVIF